MGRVCVAQVSFCFEETLCRTSFQLIRQTGFRISEDFSIGQLQTRTDYNGLGYFVHEKRFERKRFIRDRPTRNKN